MRGIGLIRLRKEAIRKDNIRMRLKEICFNARNRVDSAQERDL